MIRRGAFLVPAAQGQARVAAFHIWRDEEHGPIGDFDDSCENDDNEGQAVEVGREEDVSNGERPAPRIHILALMDGSG